MKIKVPFIKLTFSIIALAVILIFSYYVFLYNEKNSTLTRHVVVRSHSHFSFSRFNPIYPNRTLTRDDFDYKHKAEEIWGKYITKLNASESVKFLNYRCRSMCGGLGDRLRGMSTVFYWALLSGSAFTIDAPDISEVFVSVKRNNKLMRRFMRKTGKQRTMHYLIDNFDNNFASNGNMNEFLKEDLHDFHTNAMYWRQLSENPSFNHSASEYGIDKLTTFDMFRIFTQLYFSEYSNKTISLLNGVMEEMEGFKVGVQIRTGGDGTWKDPERMPKSSAEKFAIEAYNACNLSKTKDCSVFYTTDSDEARLIFEESLTKLNRDIRKAYFDAEPVHIDRSSMYGLNERTRLKTYVDWIYLNLATF